MRIYFCGHKLKYKIENIAKLFMQGCRFEMHYDMRPQGGDYILTELSSHGGQTAVNVEVSINGQKKSSGTLLAGAGGDNGADDAECAIMMETMLFNILCEVFGRRPPWGILTGVRPVRLFEKLQKMGMDYGQLREYLKNRLLVSDGKIDLALEVLKNQADVKSMAGPKDYSLYVGIPFCPSRCSYCSFVSHSIESNRAAALKGPYVERLVSEIALAGRLAQKMNLRLRTIYIGGGTPTSLSCMELLQITDAIGRHFPKPEEYTIEAGRPDTITQEKLDIIKKSGCTRISINPQTFSNNVLRVIGRGHTAEDTIKSFKLAREMGFENINMDLIAGLPKDTFEGFKKSMGVILGLLPECVTVHALASKKSSALYHEAANNPKNADMGALAVRMAAYAQKGLAAAGYAPYYVYRQKNTAGNIENIGYSMRGRQCAYNIYTMGEIHSIVALGAGGVSKLVCKNKIRRFCNYKYPYEYIDDFDKIMAQKYEMARVWAQLCG